VARRIGGLEEPPAPWGHWGSRQQVVRTNKQLVIVSNWEWKWKWQWIGIASYEEEEDEEETQRPGDTHFHPFSRHTPYTLHGSYTSLETESHTNRDNHQTRLRLRLRLRLLYVSVSLGHRVKHKCAQIDF